MNTNNTKHTIQKDVKDVSTYGGAGRVSIGKVVEQRVVSTGGTLGRRWAGAVAAGSVAWQTATVVRGVL